MTTRYRDICPSPDYPHMYVGGERDGLSVYTGDMVRIDAEYPDGTLAVDFQGGPRGVRVRAADLRRDRWNQPRA